ncbi:MAG TPA: IPT/TIG domain-containing protein [Candidatus Saccharimonadales bacterium]|nr:IPT/TIG domain-containing protein [Candidatus Saccharimonadales bacterium]
MCTPSRLRALFLACAPLLFLAGCSKSPTAPGPPAMNLVTGAPVTVATQAVSPAGGTVHVTSADSVINGLEIKVPPGAFAGARTFSVSYARVTAHRFGQFFRPISPLITVANGGGYADSIMTMTVPISLPGSAYPVAFFYDDAAGTLEPVPALAFDRHSVTVATRHFDVGGVSAGVASMKGALPGGVIARCARLVVVVTDEDMVRAIASVEPQIRTGYMPAVDDWEFVNNGSYLVPARMGMCAGQNATSLWYYYEKKRKLSAPGLYHLYDVVNATPERLWQDNPLGYRVASAVQADFNWGSITALVYEHLVGLQDEWTWCTLVTSMHFFHEPLCLGAYGLDATGQPAGHDLTAYTVDVVGRSIYVADPNFPGDRTRRVTFNGTTFDPYFSGLNAGAPGMNFTKITVTSKTTYISWNRIGELWHDVVENGQNPGFPPYELWVKQGSTLDLLGDVYHAPGDAVIVSATWSEPGRIYFTAFDRTGARVLPPPAKPWTLTDRDTIHLSPGDNVIGFCIYGEVPGAPGFPSSYLWSDFRWIDFIPSSVTLRIVPANMTGARNRQYVWGGVALGRPPSVRYEWDFGDRTEKFIATNDSVAYHTYTTDGDYTITLDVFNTATSSKLGTATATAGIHSTLQVTSVYPEQVSYAMPVYIYGRNFGPAQGTSTVNFGTYPARSIVSWSDTEIVATVPEPFRGGDATVKVGGAEASSSWLTTGPKITDTNPDSAKAGEIVSIVGQQFGYEQGHSVVVFGYVDTATVVSWSDTQVEVVVPDPTSESYGLEQVKLVLGNGSSWSYGGFSVIEDVLKTLHKMDCLEDVGMRAMMQMYYPTPAPHDEYKDKTIDILGHCPTWKLTWTGTSFAYLSTVAIPYQTDSTSVSGTVSADGKTILTLNAREVFTYTGSSPYPHTDVTEMTLQNVPLTASMPRSNLVDFGLHGPNARNCVVRLKYEVTRSGVVSERYDGTDWTNAAESPILRVSFGR